MQKQKSAARPAALWKQEEDEQTQARRRAYGNYLKNIRPAAQSPAAETTAAKGTGPAAPTSGGQDGGQPTLSGNAAPPWALKDFKQEMRKYQNTPKTPAAEKTAQPPTAPQPPVYWEQAQSQGLLELGKALGKGAQDLAASQKNIVWPTGATNAGAEPLSLSAYPEASAGIDRWTQAEVEETLAGTDAAYVTANFIRPYFEVIDGLTDTLAYALGRDPAEVPDLKAAMEEAIRGFDQYDAVGGKLAGGAAGFAGALATSAGIDLLSESVGQEMAGGLTGAAGGAAISLCVDALSSYGDSAMDALRTGKSREEAMGYGVAAAVQSLMGQAIFHYSAEFITAKLAPALAKALPLDARAAFLQQVAQALEDSAWAGAEELKKKKKD